MLQGGSTDANSSLWVPQWLQLWLRCWASENSRGIVWPFQCKGKTIMRAVIGRLCMTRLSHGFLLCNDWILWFGCICTVGFSWGQNLELCLGKGRMKCSNWVVMSWLLFLPQQNAYLSLSSHTCKIQLIEGFSLPCSLEAVMCRFLIFPAGFIW